MAVLLVFYFHAVAAMSVAGFYFGVGQSSVPQTRSVLDVILTNGFTGVSLFFVLSGFIFTWGALHSDRIRWRAFYLNRFLRIYPLFLLVNLLALTDKLPLRQLVVNLAGFGNYHLGYGIFDIVLWTISLEIQFYLLFPYLVSAMRKYGVRFLWAIIVGLTAIRVLIFLDGPYLHELVYWTMLGRLDQFVAGMILAYYTAKYGWINGTAIKSPRRIIFGLLALVAILIGSLLVYLKTGWKYGNSPFLIVWPTLEPAIWAAIAIGYVRLVRHFKPKWLGWLQTVGVISYSLYIFQYPMIKILQRSGWTFDWPGHRLAGGLVSATFIYLPLTLIVSAITFNLIEKPPLKLRKNYTVKT